jgi:hypothetical protein
MKQMPDRKRLRQDYVRKKGMAYLSVSSWRALSMACGVVTIGCGALMVLFLLNVLGLTLQLGLMSALLSLVAAILSLSIQKWIVRDRRKAEQDLANIPYIPPVTVDTLLADEILVRGAGQPTVEQSKVC